MDKNVLLGFALSLIVTVLFLLNYFKGKELKAIKSKEEDLSKLLKEKEEYFNNEMKLLLNSMRLKEELHNRERKVLEEGLSNQFEQKENLLKKEIENAQNRLNESYSKVPLLANQQFNEFKKKEIDNIRVVLADSAQQSALASLQEWQMKYEAYYRQDAISRSQSVILGKVTEHLIPFHQSFPYNPKEARFIGSPIDMIVFKGIEDEEDVEIHIIEIKTGNSQLNKRQRLIRDAVKNNRVVWRELNI